jgi:hypothetical protein
LPPPQSASRFRYVLDHIIAKQHGGKTELDNLALCCGQCNRYKGPNLASIDPQTKRVTRLFHPRRERWNRHFRYDGAVLIGLTSIARATIAALRINLPLRIAVRQALLETGQTF